MTDTSTSLVLCSESLQSSSAPSPIVFCPRRPFWMVRDDDGLRTPASCDSYRCDVCGPRKAFASAALATAAVRAAPRARFVTLTQAPDDWQARRWELNKLRRRLRAAGYSWEHAWATEKGSKTGMIHVHALQWGDYVPQDQLQDAWGHRVDIRAIHSDGIGAYVSKDALKVAGYTIKGTRASAQGMAEFLELNGGRALHWSRGFLHGMTKREAQRDLSAQLNGGELKSWHLEFDGDAYVSSLVGGGVL